MIVDPLARLASAVQQLPVAGLPPRVLNVGCGAYPAAHAFAQVRPGWTLYGVDLDGAALRRARRNAPSAHLIHADARHVRALLRAQFGLILVRHPDLYRDRAAWRQIVPALPALLAPGGALLVTLYAPEEVDMLHTMCLPPALPLDEGALAPVDLRGQDRFVYAFRA